jgi:hypothetical protein
MELEWWWEWSGAPSRVLHKGKKPPWGSGITARQPETMPCVDKVRAIPPIGTPTVYVLLWHTDLPDSMF